MIEKFRSLHKVKDTRERIALRRLRAMRDQLREASRIRCDCETAVAESAGTLPHRENAIFDEVIQKVVGLEVIDDVKEDVQQLHKAHRRLEDELENAVQRCQQLAEHVEAARQAYHGAQRARETFDLTLQNLLLEKAARDEQVEEAEMEDMFGKERWAHA